MNKIMMILATSFLAAGLNTAKAELGNGGCLSFRQGDGVCTPKCSTEKVKKHCWNVEAKPICIPAVKFPWESCCTPKCGRARCINSLKKHEYECEKNVVKWDASGVVCPQPACACGQCNGGCGGTCDHCQGGCVPGCGTAPAAQGPANEPVLAPPPPSETPAPAPAPPSAKRTWLQLPLVRR